MRIFLKTSYLKLTVSGLLSFFFIAPSISLSAFEPDTSGSVAGVHQIVLKSVAVLPLLNLSNNPEASRMVSSTLKKELKGKGWVLITPEQEVYRYLLKRRIRDTGSITRLTAREMGKVLGVDAVLLGSVSQYSGKDSSKGITVGVGSRLVSTLDGSIIWADSKSYSGAEYEHVLGLGAVTSFEVLSRYVVKDLIDGIADRFFINDSSLTPFEIRKVSTYPNIGRGGEKVTVTVEILALQDVPESVSVYLEGIETTLFKVREGVYEGTVISPNHEGVYEVDVVATDKSSVPYNFSAAGKISVDDTPPKVSLTLNRDVFSTKQQGFVMFTTTLLNIEEVDEWRLEILDSEGNVVRDDNGFGQLPQKLLWRGLKNDKSIAADGQYQYRLIVKDSAGNETILKDTLRIKSNPPDINVGVDIVDEVVLFTFEYTDDEKIQSWEFIIKNRDGDELKVFEGEGAIPKTIELPMESSYELNKIIFTLLVRDVADNELTYSKTLPAILGGKIPFAKLLRKLDVHMDDF